MLKIKRNDIVQVMKGEDRGKKGRVLRVLPQGKRALVEGINLVKKHKRKAREDQQGGIVSIEAPISLSNLMLFCKQCNRPNRPKFTVLKDGSTSRVCKACEGTI